LNRELRLGQGRLPEALRRPPHRRSGGRLDNDGLSAARSSRGRAGHPALSVLGLVIAGAVAASAARAQEPAKTEEALPREVAPATALGAPVRQNDDPLQKVNRASFGIGMGLDRYVLGPITHAYQGVTPSPIRNRVSAVVYNLGEPGTAINDVAQGHPKHAGQTASRFIINSTIGVLGIFDVATGLGLPGHQADFGQTLGRYGVKPGPYLYAPIIGPLNFRDGVGRLVDIFTDPVALLTGGVGTSFGSARLGVTGLDTRASADGAIRALDDATDPYATMRSAYTQRRASKVQSAKGQVEALPDFGPSPGDLEAAGDAERRPSQPN
jgi:phospholipid-binding lipoprotein MlaA